MRRSQITGLLRDLIGLWHFLKVGTAVEALNSEPARRRTAGALLPQNPHNDARRPPYGSCHFARTTNQLPKTGLLLRNLIIQTPIIGIHSK